MELVVWNWGPLFPNANPCRIPIQKEFTDIEIEGRTIKITVDEHRLDLWCWDHGFGQIRSNYEVQHSRPTDHNFKLYFIIDETPPNDPYSIESRYVERWRRPIVREQAMCLIDLPQLVIAKVLLFLL